MTEGAEAVEAGVDGAYWACLLMLLEKAGYGAVIRSESGAVLAINSTAQELLERVGTTTRKQARSKQELNDVLSRILPRGIGVPQIGVAHETRLLACKLPIALPGERSLIILLDPDTNPRPCTVTLQNVWKLTPAEASLAADMAQGASPSELAKRLGISRTTVRTHLSSIFSKTQTRRQAQLVALLLRVSIFSLPLN